MNKQSFQFKNNIVKKALQANKIDAMLFLSTQNRFWYSGFNSTEGFVVVTKNKSYLLIDNRYYEAAIKKVTYLDIITFNSLEDLRSLLTKLKVKTLGLENEHATLSNLKTINDFKTKVIGVDTTIFRAQKTNEEIVAMKKSADIAAKAINWSKKNIKIGETETEVRAKILNFFMENNASGSSFNIIVAFGKNTSIPHHQPTKYKLQKNDLIKLDIGCIFDGYCSDITRTFSLSKMTDKQKEIYNIVLEANKRGIKALKPGILGSDIDKICRDYIIEKGYGKYFTHGTGHGLGIEIHELPNVKPSYKLPIMENSVVTIEPGIYIPNFGGVRIEDSVIVTKKGNIVLTKKALK